MRLRSFLLPLVLWASAAHAASAGCDIGKMAELPVVMHGLRPTIMAKINGVEAPFIFDSGAFFSMLTPGGAARLGLRAREAPPNLVVIGVGGRAHVQLTTASELNLGGVTYKNADFLISEKGLDSSVVGLLGGNLTVRADIEYDLANGVIRLFHEEGCKDASLAYWAGNKPVSTIDIDQTYITDSHLRGFVSINGVKVKALFDTGAPTSNLSLAAAARAGVTPRTPGVIDAGTGAGIGLRSYVEDWIGPFASFKIGDEEIRNTRLRFGDMDLSDNTGMLVGADFFLSHRIFVSRSQHKLYFTYNGGPVFNLAVAPQRSAAAAAAVSAPTSTAASGAEPGGYSNAPVDAVGFSRRAAASAGRQDYLAAIDDLTKAIALDPQSADYVYQRALARLRARQPLLAKTDLDQALALQPDNMRVLLTRAEFRFGAKNLTGAREDLAAAERLAAKDPIQRLELAGAYQRAAMWTESIAALDPWIAAFPKDDRLPQALNARCWARAMLGLELDKALADCDAALRLLPGQPGFLDSRGLVHLRRGEFDRGMADFQDVLRLDPNNPWALYGRGWARVKKGRTEEGQADIKAAIAIRPKLVEEAKARGLTL